MCELARTQGNRNVSMGGDNLIGGWLPRLGGGPGDAPDTAASPWRRLLRETPPGHQVLTHDRAQNGGQRSCFVSHHDEACHNHVHEVGFNQVDEICNRAQDVDYEYGEEAPE